jgi:hypothetical protein
MVGAGVGAHDRHSKAPNVTSWGTKPIADWAQAAGFKGDALHDAVSLALAVSNGADHYAHNPITAPGAERRGLWGIRRDEVPEGLIVDLFDPRHNATVARALWEASGGAFTWHPTWINGAPANLRPVVVATLTRRGVQRGVVSRLGFSDQLAHAVSRANAFAQMSDYGEMPHA